MNMAPNDMSEEDTDAQGVGHLDAGHNELRDRRASLVNVQRHLHGRSGKLEFSPPQAREVPLRQEACVILSY